MSQQRPTPRVICLGLSALDITWHVEALPQGGGKTRANDVREGGGGMAAMQPQPQPSSAPRSSSGAAQEKTAQATK